MIVSLTGVEILEIAIETERQGAAFYERLATSAQDERVKEECRRLAAFEREHEKTFRYLLGQRDVQRALNSLQPGQLSDKYRQYLSALVDSNMLPDEEAAQQLAEEATSEADAVNIALQMEKNTILFYQELQKLLGQEAGVLQTILDEERSHVYELNELKTYLQT